MLVVRVWGDGVLVVRVQGWCACGDDISIIIAVDNSTPFSVCAFL